MLRTKKAEVPLLDASFVFRRINDRTWSLRIVFDLNPTRLLSHCGGHIDRLRRWRPDDYFRPAGDRREEIRQHTLDGTDNFLPDADVRRTVNLSRQEVHELAIRSAIEFVEALINPPDPWDTPDDPRVPHPSQRQRSSLPVQVQFDWERWHIKQLEQHWEFDVRDAITTIHAFSRPTSEIAEGLRETIYANSERTQTTAEWADEYFEDDEADDTPEQFEPSSTSLVHPENALSLMIPLRSKVSLLLYAKAARRIRCEVRYFTNPRTIYNRRPEVTAYTTDQFENLVSLLGVIADRSAQRANQFLQTLWQRVDRPVGTVVTLSTFLSHIAEACHQTNVDMNTVLSPLIAHGRVHRTGGPRRIAAIDRLIEMRVLIPTTIRHRSSGREYALTRRYADVVEHLARSLRE